MRNYRDAKAMAQTLRDGLKTRSINITHSTALELTAKALGFKDWQVLAARIEADRSASGPTESPQAASFPTLYCSFCGKSQHVVSKLIAGPNVFICDECVDLCNDIVLGQDPVNYADAPETLNQRSVEELVLLERRTKVRIPQMHQILELTESIVHEAGGSTRSEAPDPSDPQRAFVLGKSPQERLAYLAVIKQRLAAVERVAETVAGLLAERGRASGSA